MRRCSPFFAFRAFEVTCRVSTGISDRVPADFYPRRWVSDSSQGKGRAETYVGFFNKSVEGVTGPLEVHCRSWEILTRNLDIAMLPSRFVASNTRISWWGRRPSGSGDEFETVSRRVVFEREVRDGDDDRAFYFYWVLFTSIGYRADDDRGFGCGWNERFPEC